MDLESQQALIPPPQPATLRPTNIATWLSRLVSSAMRHHRRAFTNDHRDDFTYAYGEEDEPALRAGPLECPYPRPFLILDLIWNLGFVLVAGVVLLTTVAERPSTPLRLWVGGYALQCLLHVAFVWVEYQRTVFDYHDVHSLHPFSLLCHHSLIKRLESINTVISSVWGRLDSIGFIWVDRLSVVFLAFDAFFMVFCIGMACIVFVLLVCCFPVLARVAMTVGDGASENDIKALPKFRFCRANTAGRFSSCETQEEACLMTHLGSGNNVPVLALSSEDSKCCICLHSYEDGVELCNLPCSHHFHYRCICKWLRINAICPLCRFNILHGEMLV